MTQNNSNQPEDNQGAFARGMFFLGVILLLGLLFVWFFDNELSQQFNPNQNVRSTQSNDVIEVTLERNQFNHYVANGKINDQDVVLFLDTGATAVSIPENIANALRLPKGRQSQAMTANGVITVYETVLDSIAIGDIELKNIRATINPNAEEIILLGMSFLKELDFSQRGNSLTLKQYR